MSIITRCRVPGCRGRHAKLERSIWSQVLAVIIEIALTNYSYCYIYVDCRVCFLPHMEDHSSLHCRKKVLPLFGLPELLVHSIMCSLSFLSSRFAFSSKAEHFGPHVARCRRARESMKSCWLHNLPNLRIFVEAKCNDQYTGNTQCNTNVKPLGTS